MLYRQINRCPTLLSSSPPGGIIFLCDTSYISLLCCHGLPRHLPVQEKEIILLFAFVSVIGTILLAPLCHSKRAVMHLPVSARQLPPEDFPPHRPCPASCSASFLQLPSDSFPDACPSYISSVLFLAKTLVIFFAWLRISS